MLIIVDSDEKRPFTFRHMVDDLDQPVTVRTYKRKLIHGDYSVLGIEQLITVERKSSSDLQKSLCNDRTRFEGCVERMNDQLTVAHIVVEGDLARYNKNTAWSIRRTIHSWVLRYPKVHWWLQSSRREAEVWTYQLLVMAHKKIYS